MAKIVSGFKCCSLFIISK